MDGFFSHLTQASQFEHFTFKLEQLYTQSTRKLVKNYLVKIYLANKLILGWSFSSSIVVFIFLNKHLLYIFGEKGIYIHRAI